LALNERFVPAIGTIIVILGDQLTRNLSSLQNADPATSIVLMAEVATEASYVKHHKKKMGSRAARSCRNTSGRLRNRRKSVRQVAT
jgi:deoxyribodipyrimidine photolyase-related protein